MNSLNHLTDDQVDDYLIGDLNAELTQHLAICRACQARVAEMEGPIGSFKDVTLAWSERQSSTLPIRPEGIRAKSPGHHRAVWGIAVATAVVAVCVVLPVAHHNAVDVPVQRVTETSGAIPQSFTAEREQQIAQDNQMLQAIDRELGAPVSSPSETFGLDMTGRSEHATSTGAVRD